MKAYLVTPGNGSPRYFVSSERDARGGARETGGNWETQDVPTVGRDLLPFLNRLLRNRADDAAPAAAPPPPHAASSPAPGRCPKCHMTRRGAELHAKGIEADALAEAIMGADSFVLTNLVGAVVARFEKLRTEATKLGGEGGQ